MSVSFGCPFLVAPQRLYMRLCPSVCLSVGLSVGLSSKNYKKKYKTLQNNTKRYKTFGKTVKEALAVCRSFLDRVVIFQFAVSNLKRNDQNKAQDIITNDKEQKQNNSKPIVTQEETTSKPDDSISDQLWTIMTTHIRRTQHYCTY